MGRTLEGLQNPGIETAADESLVDMEYKDEIVLVSEEARKAQVSLDEVNKFIPSFGMRFAPTKSSAASAERPIPRKIGQEFGTLAGPASSPDLISRKSGPNSQS
ncbi:hypothetical protein CLF_112227 [Clonorchis sinensis]|uniref:Reverse transcriptase domain-containing protein n=1 Tax=Clonorchis sinensis TaxID=79923 RepID=G7YW08_CLOSI|nr:hypothetical protein CLF_112227 [Clonorchis sinensis]